MHRLSYSSDRREALLRRFDCYQSLIDDWPAFLDALQTPLPTCLWTNTLRTSSGHLQEVHPELIAIPWYQGGFRAPPKWKPGSKLGFYAGLYLIQEEAALLPVKVLDPQPGEWVADLCAAPGNKTVQMAVRMRDRGVILANDRNRERLHILLRSISRLGITTISLANQDATHIRNPVSVRFDKVLVDVPCSGEGTARKIKGIQKQFSPAQRAKLQRIQQSILKRALALCKPGGRIVYSTCTFSPEENESVLHDVLTNPPSRPFTIEPFDIPGLRYSPGITRWNGQDFDPEVQNAVRIWPHQNDTGGFFVALLTKKGGSVHQTISPVSPQDHDSSQNDLIGYAMQHFGIPESVLASYYTETFGSKYVDLYRLPAYNDPLPPVWRRGLPFMKTTGKTPKLRTGAALFLFPHATQNKISLSGAQLERYLEGHSFTIESHQSAEITERGYVLVGFEGMGLGLVFCESNEAGAVARNVLPKHWTHR